MQEFDIAQRLKELRKKADLTQEEFAEYADMSYKFYQHIESGRKKLLRIDTIQRICSAYKITLSEFFSEDMPKHLKLNIAKHAASNIHYTRRNTQEEIIKE